MESLRVFTSFSQSLLHYMKRRAFAIDFCSLVLAAALSRVCVFESVFPFGFAFMVGADMAGRNVYYPCVGVVIGALASQGTGGVALWGVIIYAALRLLYPILLKKLHKLDKLIVATAASALLLPIFYIESWTDFLKGVSGMGLSLLLCLSYQNALRALLGLEGRQRLHDEEQIAICLFTGSVALSLFGVGAYSFSLGLVLAVWATMLIAYAKGLPAVAAAVTLGAMLLLGGSVQPILLADIALCALAAVVCKSMGAWGVAAGFIICCGITEKYIGGAGGQIGMINAVPAAAGLVFIPKRGQLYLKSLVDSGAKEERTARAMLKRIQTSTAEEISRTVGTVDEVAELFAKRDEWVHDPIRERDDMRRAALHICADCTYRASCWRDEGESMNAVESMISSHAKGLRPRACEPLRYDCEHTSSIAAAASQARDAYREKCMQAYHAASDYAFVNRQLHGVGALMRKLSSDIKEGSWPDETVAQILTRRLERDGIAINSMIIRQRRGTMHFELRLARGAYGSRRVEEALSRAFERRMRVLSVRENSREQIMELEPAQRLKSSYGAATRPKRGGALSGDSTGMAALPNGHMLYVLSDGMGSGTAAHDQSDQAVKLLIRLYSVGYERDVALECVNRLLMNKGGTDMYATLDALHIDQKSGEAEFIKFGASPSFVLREGEVHTIYAEALPAGILESALPAVHSAALKQDDSVILLTDGALDALGEDAKDEILMCVGGANTCEDAAEALLNAAASRGVKDDMTVMVVRLE